MDTAKYILEGEELSKKFGRNTLFRDIRVALSTGQSLAIAGPNGSGKSTLLKILAGLQNPTAGTVSLAANGPIDRTEWLSHIGYTGPLVNPYDDLTGWENITFAASHKNAMARAASLLEHFSLARHRDKKIKHYSSGMKQRLKIILAIVNEPPVLMLDEAGTNLDAGGTSLLHDYLESVRHEKIIILATNNADEEKLCGGVIRLG